MGKKPEVVRVGKAPVTPIAVKERKQIAKQIENGRERLGEIYPEVHGKVVDFITHGISDGILYVRVPFTDETNFSRHGHDSRVCEAHSEYRVRHAGNVA